MLASKAVFAGMRSRTSRVGITAALLALSAIPTMTGRASGEERLADLQGRMNALQAELDASAAKVEAAHTKQEEIANRLAGMKDEMARLEKRNNKLELRATKRATALYKAGNTGMVEVLFDAENFAEITQSAEMLSRVSLDDNGVFIELARSRDRLAHLSEDLKAETEELAAAEAVLKDEAARLQAQFASVAAEYDSLKQRLTASAPAQRPATSSVPVALKGTGGMFCPVAGPVSFVDSWGAPRSGGRSHQGVDMMAAYGTPQVAIVSGSITYAGYDGLGGNIQYLSGDDGNVYVYIHSASFTVTSGHVDAGQQISVLGDTGNAAGTPHLHFEFHPGGGAAVNPTPLVASIC